MAAVNSKDTCNSCLFFVVGERMGICKRYPSAVNKSNDDWCGEYHPPKNPVFENISYTINVDSVKPEEFKKQRGRPKKT